MIYPPASATNRQAAILNAIAPYSPETAADRTQRHLRTCREMAELGMDIARAAARETVNNLKTPIEHPMPGAALPPVCRVADPDRLFTRVCHAVRQAMALEIRVAAGEWRPLNAPAQPHGPLPSGPDHANCKPAKTRLQTAGPAFRPERDETLEDECAAGNRSIPEIIAAICTVLGTAPARSAANPDATRPEPHRKTPPARPKPPVPPAPIPLGLRGPPPPRPG